MTARVCLTATRGLLQGQRFVFTRPVSCTIGRGTDCFPRFPSIWAHWNISRRHCEILIDPPCARVKDLGSLNGTYLNGQLIGQRDSKDPQNGLEHELHDGDELTLGDATFLVNIVSTADSETCPEVAEPVADAVACVV